MPRDTKEPLGTIRYLHSNPTKFHRLKLLQHILAPYVNKEESGKKMFSGIFNCTKWVTRYDQVSSMVTIQGFTDNRIKILGVQTCRSIDCPNCAGFVRDRLSDKLSKAVQACLWDRGEVRFITATKSPEIEDEVSVSQILEYAEKSRVMVANWNYKKKTKIGYWITPEVTFSSKVMIKHYSGVSCSPKLYLHGHIHSLLLVRTEDVWSLERLEIMLRELWVKTVGFTFAQSSKNAIDRMGVTGEENKKSYRRSDFSRIGFRSEVVTEEKGIAKYLNKLLDTTSNIGNELTMGQSKGDLKSGMGLNIALNKMLSPECSHWERRELKRLVRVWFVSMFNKQRHRKTRVIDTFVKRFDDIRYEVIRKYHDRFYADKILKEFQLFGDLPFFDSLKDLRYDRLCRGESEDGYHFPKSSLTKVLSVKDELPVWEEMIMGSLWTGISARMHSSVVVDIFKGYHNEGRYKAIYRHLKQLNFRIRCMYESGHIGSAVEEGVDSLVLLCYSEGLL